MPTSITDCQRVTYLNKEMYTNSPNDIQTQIEILTLIKYIPQFFSFYIVFFHCGQRMTHVWKSLGKVHRLEIEYGLFLTVWPYYIVEPMIIFPNFLVLIIMYNFYNG